MRFQVRSGLLLGFAALAHAAAAQVVSTPHGYLLQASYHPKQILKFSAVMGIKGVVPGKEVGFSYPLTLTVQKLVKGVAYVRIAFGPVKSATRSMPLNLQPASLKLDRHNKPIGSTQSAPVALFPTHPVKMGEKWSGMSSYTVGGKNGGYAVETEYKLTGQKTERGKHIFVLTLNFKGFASGEGTILVDGADGSVLSEVLDLTMKTSQGTYPVQIINKRT
jgi:hypothetical protein